VRRPACAAAWTAPARVRLILRRWRGGEGDKQQNSRGVIEHDVGLGTRMNRGVEVALLYDTGHKYDSGVEFVAFALFVTRCVMRVSC